MESEAFSFFCLQEQLFFFNKIKGSVLLLASPVTDIETQQVSKTLWEKMGLFNFMVAHLPSFLSLRSLVMYKNGVCQALSPALMPPLFCGGFF